MKKTILLAAVLVSFVGCSDGLDEEESQKAWGSTQQSLTQGSAAAQASADGPADTFMVDHDFSCFEGGSATFTGSFEDVEGADNQSNVNFNYSVTYDNCVSQGITANGSLTYAATVEITDDSVKTTLDFRGDLDYTGDVEGACTVDMQGFTNVMTTDTGANISLKYEGSICGNDADASLNQDIDIDFGGLDGLEGI